MRKEMWGKLVVGLLLCVGMLGAASSVLATDVCGPIGVDTTWTLAGSPYIVICGVLVMPGVTLTIEPGAAVKFTAQTALQIDGELNAIGTEGSMITFTSNAGSPAPGDWGYIKFSDTSVDAVFDGETYLDGLYPGVLHRGVCRL